ncbi:MAG: phosphatase PAP2 family protein [Xanthomonadales bacterium]|nr:phosphatase PAP2 family protein [Xanthomonadales bacterium]
MPIPFSWTTWCREHWRRLLVLAFASLLPLLWFGAIAEDLIEYQRFAYDAPIMNGVHRVASARLDGLMRLISKLGQNWGVVPLDIAVLVILLARRRWSLAGFWAAAVGGAAVLTVAAKLLFHRARPDLWVSVASEKTFSFPSGHAMGSMAAVAALVVLLWPTRWRYFALIIGAAFVVAVGLSRVYLGVHYPSDVLAGWTGALGWVVGVAALMWNGLSGAVMEKSARQQRAGS